MESRARPKDDRSPGRHNSDDERERRGQQLQVVVMGRRTHLIVQVDVVGLESLQRGVDGVTHVLRCSPDMHTVFVGLDAKLGGEEHVLPLSPLQSLACMMKQKSDNVHCAESVRHCHPFM